MKISTWRLAWLRLVLVCVCFLSISVSLGAEIIFQHNFENLDNPPTDTQLSAPNIINPALSNIFLNSGLLYRTRTDAGTKALSITASGNTAVYVLRVQMPICKKLTISSISFKGFASDNANFSISLNGEAYGVAVGGTGNTYTDVKQIKKVNISAIQDIAQAFRVEITVNSGQPGTLSSIDDLTIEGQITDAASNLSAIKFPYSSSIPLQRCPGAGSMTYTANLNTPHKSISYELDAASKAAGITMVSGAYLTYPPTFAGTVSLTAIALGCANETFTKTIDITTIPSGPSSTDMDFQTKTMSSYCNDCGDLKNSKYPCLTAGVIYKSGFESRYAAAKVRFEGGVLNFEITGSPSTAADARPGFDLYFRQSDFDNYHGTLSLPTGPSDEQGKENLRLIIQTISPSGGNPVQKLKPVVFWNEAGKWWVISYKFSNQGLAEPWPANNFKVFLSDTQTPFVKLESIAGIHTSSGDQLTWRTAEQTNFSHFEIENSEDTLQGFQNIATIPSNNDPSGGEYHYTHIPSAALKQYYRLKVVYTDNTFSYSKILTVRSDIIYQHTFENLSNPPSEAQLATPDMIAPSLTSLWSGNSENLSTFNRADVSTVLKLESYNKVPVLILNLKIPNCKKLDITDFSLFVFSGDYTMKVNGSSIDFKTTAFWSRSPIAMMISGLTGEVTIEISHPISSGNPQMYLDDFTIYGKLYDNLVDLRTLNLSGTGQRCQQGQILSYQATRYGEYKSIQYSLDNLSLAAGNQIDVNTGLLTFSPTFAGETTVSASAVNCINIPISASKRVFTISGGLPTSDMDLLVKLPHRENSSGYNSAGNLESGCYTTGSVGLDGFFGQTVTTKVRFRNNVRSFVISAALSETDDYTSPKMELYFSQSDFDNYSGALKLPKNPSDEQGKANLRLRIFSANFLPYYSTGEIDVKPDLRWDNVKKYWVATLRFFVAEDSGPSNAPNPFPNFKVSLTDAKMPLPVKLESFSAKPSPEGNRLNWKTTEEIDFKHFEVERSEDPRQGFQYLATVSSGNNATGGSYQYTDIQNATSQQYYRLKMVDIDGSFEYSRIVNVNAQNNAENLFVYPNPAQNLIYLDSPDVIYSVNLTDQNGNVVYGKSLSGAEKSLSISLPKLNSGAYLLKVNPGTESQKVRKVLIK
ncbi:T9SS type A sorting domain-containing protein [Dyadobacter luticola]|nr:T9SS type A sorting domain-containing protein [Dyadobacter luticola]